VTAANGALWTAPEAAAATRGAWRAEPAGPIGGVSIDTRSLQPGDLFVALEGPNRDAHDFVAAALAAGAAGALVARLPAGLGDAAPLLVADDTQAALERLGIAARARSQAGIAAVTGSVGKTGTKEMLALALGASGPAHRSLASYNNLWGVPLSLARMPREAAWGVFEIGMNHAGEIAPLVRQVRPDVAIVTNVEPAHLEFFASVEAIADAKAEIFEGLEPAGAAILNADNPLFARLSAAAAGHGIDRVLSFGAAADAWARLDSLEAQAGGSIVEAAIGGRPVRYRLSVPGRHHAMNSLAVLAAVAALGADLEAGAAHLEKLRPLPGRGRQVEIAVGAGSATLIDESYNASPAAMRAALAVLGAVEPGPGGRRIAVLGDMRELGDSGPELHRALAADLEAAGVAVAFTCGPLMRHLFDALPHGIWGAHAPTAQRLLSTVLGAVAPGDVILVKGSLGSRMADIVKPLEAGAAARPARRAHAC
jgi:UDP-N-acetylmuramoyl-tripeptide--D-alanyl-D-alanine ligase